MRPVIVGAGIGGLCAASLLSLSGKDSLVLEREHRVGGRATSYSYEGCLLDHGWHASYYKEGYVGGHIGAILNDLGLPLKLEKLDPPLSMFRNGKIESVVGFRHVPADLRPVLTKLAAEIRAISYEKTHEFDDVTVHEWAQQKTDHPLLLKHFNLSSYFAITATSDKASAGEYFRVLQLATSICEGLGYPVNGCIRTIADTLRTGIESRRGEVVTQAEVVSMEMDGERISTVAYQKEEDICEIHPEYVIFNPPVYFILDYVTEFPSAFTETLKKMEGQHTGPSTQVYFLLDKKMLHTPSLALIPEDADMWQPQEHCAIFSPSNLSGTVAPSGKQLLLMAVPYTGKSVEDEAQTLLESIFPGVDDHIDWIHSVTTEMVDGLAKHVGLVGSHKVSVSSPIENLYFVGDTVEGTGPGMELPADSAKRCVAAVEGVNVNEDF